MDRDTMKKILNIPATPSDTFKAITEVYATAIRNGDSVHNARYKAIDFIDFMSVEEAK